jgi:transcription initiation factor IIE alpha subunit
VICDRCALRFKIQPQRREIEGGGEEHFFACPRCGAEYVMAWITERGVELRERIAEIREELKTARGEARKTLLRQLGQVVWELEPEVAGAKG